MRLQGRVAVVTGAASGIGRAVAIRYAAEGAAVAVCDVVGDGAEEVAGEIEAAGGAALAVALDVADRDAVFDAFARVRDHFDGLDVVVNNAGITRPAMIGDIAFEDWRAVYAVNVDGLFHGIQAAASIMRPRGGGRIINTTSGSGLLGDVGQLHYSSSKGAVAAMTKSAARELGRYGITVNAVSPGALTPMTRDVMENPKFGPMYLKMIPLGRLAEPEEIAPSYVFLASDDAAYVTGVILRVDGGRAIGV